MRENLNIGCGNDYRESSESEKWINVDKVDVKKDMSLNLEKIPYPFESNSFDLILAKHVIEHIHQDKFIEVMDELHRILKEDGNLVIVCPCDNKSGDPTHVHIINPNTFSYLKNFKVEKVSYRCDKLKWAKRFMMHLFPFNMLHYEFEVILKKA